MLDMNPPKVDLDSKTKIPQRYLPKHLTKKDRSVVRKNLIQSRKLYKKKKYFVRPKIKSFKSKKSNHLNRLKNIYGVKNALPSKELSEKTKCSLDALQQIVKKGEGAYLSSGSRPNQTPHSWGIARLASSLTGGNASVVDYHVLEEGCKPDSKALKLAKKQCKKIGRKCGNNKTKIKKNKKNKTLKMKGGDEDLLECSICFNTILPSQTIFSCANGHIFHIDCARNYCISRRTRNLGYTFECPLCRDTTRTCPPAAVPQDDGVVIVPYTNEINQNEIIGFDGITTGPIINFRVGSRNIFSTRISGLGNDVFLTAVIGNNDNVIGNNDNLEVGLLLLYDDIISVNNFQDSWDESDIISITTYGDWLDDHNNDDSVYDYGEDGYDYITRGRLTTMIINQQFYGRRLYIENSRLHLFDGETHQYLGSTYEYSPSIIINYIYENVYTPIYET